MLLYNFFGSSPLKDHWRVIYEFMKEQDLLDPAAASPHFSQAKHNLLCSELKQLYVAITRTRQRMWICENIEECSKPMFDYWKKLCLVQVTKLNESLANAMRVASTPEEWKATGMKVCPVLSNNNIRTTIIVPFSCSIPSQVLETQNHHASKGDIMSLVLGGLSSGFEWFCSSNKKKKKKKWCFSID